MPFSLAGKRVVITRAASQCEALAKELSARGAIPIVVPLVSFADPEDFGPLDTALARLEQFDWLIFTSAQAVRAVVTRSENIGLSLNRNGAKLKVAAVGPVSAEAARQAGFTVAHVADTHNGVALAEELGERVHEKSIFLPRSDRANPDLPAALKRHGARVAEAIAYRTLRPSEVDQRKLGQVGSGEADAILFFSPTAVEHLVELLGNEKMLALQDALAITAVGPVTAAALREAGLQRVVMAADTTTEAVVVTLEKYFAEMPKHSAAGMKRG